MAWESGSELWGNGVHFSDNFPQIFKSHHPQKGKYVLGYLLFMAVTFVFVLVLVSEGSTQEKFQSPIIGELFPIVHLVEVIFILMVYFRYYYFTEQRVEKREEGGY